MRSGDLVDLARRHQIEIGKAIELARLARQVAESVLLRPESGVGAI